MDGNVSVCVDGCVCRAWMGIQCAPGVYDGDRDFYDRRDLYIHLAGDWISVGKAGMGRLLGLGCANDFHANLDVSLYRIYRVIYYAILKIRFYN